MAEISTLDKFKYFNQRLKEIGYHNPDIPFPLPNAIATLIRKGTYNGLTAKGGLRQEFENSVTYNEVVETLVKHVVVHSGVMADKMNSCVSGSDDTVRYLWSIIKLPSEENIKIVHDLITGPQDNNNICMEMAKCYIDDNISREYLDKNAYQKYPMIAQAYAAVEQYYQKRNGYGQK